MHQPEAPIWIYPKNDPNWVRALIAEFNLHPVTAEVLATRPFHKLDAIHKYLYAKLPALYDPYLLPDMDKAVHRILRALYAKENILIYGDNDVDGITSTALLTEFLQFLHAHVSYHIPRHNTLKQDLASDVLEFVKGKNIALLITVDCGITAKDTIRKLREQGTDVIVTDHHEPLSVLPSCTALINPKLSYSSYPEKNLTGVGVAFKLAHGISHALINSDKIRRDEIDLKRYLDLVALGTIADMGSLLGENRILIRYGLRQMRKTRRIGLTKLFALCNIKSSEFTASYIASKIAPRLNSPGRIADPYKVVELLLTRSIERAEHISKELDSTNHTRQTIEKHNTEAIDRYLIYHPSLLQNKAFVLSSTDWHPGVIPIIAAKMAKQYNRPTILIAIEEGIGKGSMRTIPEFPLINLLKENSQLLESFGGHDFAAGFLIKAENIPPLRRYFIEKANTLLTLQDLTPKLHLDAEISLRDLTFDFMESLHLLEPFGLDNPAPIFYSKVEQLWPCKSIGEHHLKLYLTNIDSASHPGMLEGIGFGMSHRKKELQSKLPLYIAFTPQINHFLTKSNIQLLIRDFKICRE